MFQVMLAALAMYAQSTPAAADQAPAAAAPAAAAPMKVAQDDDPITCTYENILGTRFPKKICMHKSERAQKARDSRDAAERMQRMGPSMTGSPGS